MSNTPSTRWKPGDVANGRYLGTDGVWRPLGEVQPQPWWARPATFTGIVVATLLSLLIVMGMLADGTAKTAEAGGEPRATSSPSTGPSAGAVARTPAPSPTPPPAPAPGLGPTPSPTPNPTPEPRLYLVARIVDGDTLELGNGQLVRLVGIDTPERGQCGYAEASDRLAEMALGKEVTLTLSDEDKDRYGRLLRYVDVGPIDVGLRQIEKGSAIARYDSRDGYGFHPRERSYIKADRASKAFACPRPEPALEPATQPQTEPQPATGNCMSGYTPCLPIVGDLDCGEIGHSVSVTGNDPYRLDADGDGVGCDSE